LAGGEIKCPACGDQTTVPSIRVKAAPGGHPSSGEWWPLQMAADRLMIDEYLGGAGIASMAFGLLAVVQGTGFLNPGLIKRTDLWLVALGILLVAEGMVVRAKRSPGGLLADGVALIVISLWNFAAVMASGALSNFWPLVATLQFYFGVQCFRRYSRVGHLKKREPVDPELAERIKQEVQKARRASIKDDDAVITITANGFMGLPQNCKGYLGPSEAILLSNSGHDIFVAERHHVDLDARTPSKEQTTATLSVRGRKVVKGRICREHLLRFEKWKSPASGDIKEDNVE